MMNSSDVCEFVGLLWMLRIIIWTLLKNQVWQHVSIFFGLGQILVNNRVREVLDLAEISTFPVPFFKTDGTNAPKLARPIKNEKVERPLEKHNDVCSVLKAALVPKDRSRSDLQSSGPVFQKSSLPYQKVMKSVVKPDFARFTINYPDRGPL